MVYRKTYQRDIPFDSSERGEVLLAAANLAVEQDEVSFGVFVPDSAPTFAVEQVSVRDDCDVLTLDMWIKLVYEGTENLGEGRTMKRFELFLGKPP